MIDQSMLEKCFEVPNLASEKRLREIKRDINYVTPNLNNELVNDIKQEALNESANFYRIVE